MNRALVAVAALALGLMLTVSGIAAPPHVTAEAPMVNSLAPLAQKELHWGMTHLEVIDAYNKPAGLFDHEYAPQIAKLQPGVEMDQLLADRDSRKVNFERGYTEFGDSPTGYDVTPIHSEYSYGNGEAIQRLFKDGRARFFFYMKDHLWKILDEIPLKADAPLGDSFRAAVAKLNAILAVPGRVRAADPSQGLDRATADWQDSATHLRAVDRSNEHLVGLVLEDRRTLANLQSYRSNKPQDLFKLDPAIAALTKGGISDPSGPRVPEGDAGAGKKKR